MAPIGAVTTEARRIRALTTRDRSRSIRGATPYSNGNTFKLTARIHSILESSIGQRGEPQKLERRQQLS